MKICIYFWIYDLTIFDLVMDLYYLEFPFSKLVSVVQLLLHFSCYDMKMCHYGIDAHSEPMRLSFHSR